MDDKYLDDFLQNELEVLRQAPLVGSVSPEVMARIRAQRRLGRLRGLRRRWMLGVAMLLGLVAGLPGLTGAEAIWAGLDALGGRVLTLISLPPSAMDPGSPWLLAVVVLVCLPPALLALED